MTSMKVRSRSLLAHHSIRDSSSSSLNPFRATVLILTRIPADRAFSIPSRTWGSRPQRVIRANLSGSRVSSETLILLTPHSNRSVAKRRSCDPVRRHGQLVEASGFEVPRHRAEELDDVPANQRLASGDPQFAHAFPDEGGAQPVEFLQRQQLGLWKKRHVLRHAVHASEIATIGDRNAKIGDRAVKRINKSWGFCHARRFTRLGLFVQAKRLAKA